MGTVSYGKRGKTSKRKYTSKGEQEKLGNLDQLTTLGTGASVPAREGQGDVRYKNIEGRVLRGNDYSKSPAKADNDGMSPIFGPWPPDYTKGP